MSVRLSYENKPQQIYITYLPYLVCFVSDLLNLEHELKCKLNGIVI